MKISGIAGPALILLAAAVVGGCGSDNGQGSSSSGGIPYPGVPQDSGGITSASKNLAFLHSAYASSNVSPTPWAGYWWPYQTNGILEAAQKYDAADAAAPGGAANWEYGNHGQGLGSVADWWGHCNGWAAAAVLRPEPRAGGTVDGVFFSVADRKALLSETYMEVTGQFLGTRVDDPGDTSSAAFSDVTPAEFYLMLAHVLGVQERPFVFDRYTGYQVWNHPAAAYSHEPITSSDYLGPDPQAPDVHRVNVTTTIWWVQDNVPPGDVTPPFDPGDTKYFGQRKLLYELWLDAAPQFDASGKLRTSGNIILTRSGGRKVGGRWKGSSSPLVESYPDYIWIPTGPQASTGFKNPRVRDEWVLNNMR